MGTKVATTVPLHPAVQVAPPSLTSASALIAFLHEDNDQLRFFALSSLDSFVNQFWAEIADSIETIEELFEDEKFQHRKLAALLASKVHYHLEEYNESLQYALGAEDLFDVTSKSEYVDTIVSKCIDEYITRRVELTESSMPGLTIDTRLEQIVERMFNRCFAEEQWKQAIGIGLESRRLDKVEEAIKKSQDSHELLNYTFETCRAIISIRHFRDKVFRLLVQLYRELERPNYLQMCTCLLFLGDAKETAQILENLIKSGNEDDELIALQIAFDLSSSEMQHFLNTICSTMTPPIAAAPTAGGDAMQVDGGAAAAPVLSADEIRYASLYKRIQEVLRGVHSISLHLDFLCRNTKADMLILNNTKAALEVRNSVTHQAMVFANATMHCGTTVHTFVSENLEWFKRSTNWAKFSATACFGMINKGCVTTSQQVMREYLPQPGRSSSPYSEGGAFYALGLIHANHGEGILPFLINSLRGATNEVIQHGACLGLGLAGMATENEEAYLLLKDLLFQDNAVAGEAAGIAMGLVMLGSHSEAAIEAMLNYAHETQHEKIIRGLAMGIALLCYGREEESDVLIEQLTRDKDPIIRYGGMFAIAMAYSATGNNTAIRRLLHVAVSDVSDDVRRAAVMSLGFVLCNIPQQCPRVVSLLSESYNPHVRYGATMAVGISCAGTGLKEAIDLLEPLTTDATDFVRQGALIALAMVLCQQNEAREPRMAHFRSLFDKVVADKHEDVMAKFGAIIALGLIDAGGRNVTISLRTSNGQPRMSGIVGMALFAQGWYWFPMMHFISLTFAPTCTIGLTRDLQMPKFSFISNSKPSLFAYPPPIQTASKSAPTRVASAILSTTAKTKARELKKESEKVGGSSTPVPMDVDPPTTKDEAAKEKPVEEEPATTTLHNPARVLTAQQKFLNFDGCRFQPVKKAECGILLLRDTTPDVESAFMSLTTQHVPAGESIDDEPQPPAPFEYVE